MAAPSRTGRWRGVAHRRRARRRRTRAPRAVARQPPCARRSTRSARRSTDERCRRSSSSRARRSAADCEDRAVAYAARASLHAAAARIRRIPCGTRRRKFARAARHPSSTRHWVHRRRESRESTGPSCRVRRASCSGSCVNDATRLAQHRPRRRDDDGGRRARIARDDAGGASRDGREALCDARDREAENRADRAVAGEPASWTRRLADFLGSAPPPPPPPPQPSREEQLSFRHARPTASEVSRALPPRAGGRPRDANRRLTTAAAGGGDGGGGGFVPTYEYQEARRVVTTLPPGLQVDLPLERTPRRARIPPRCALSVWRLRDRGRGYFRTEVTRATTVGELDARLRAWAGPASVGAELHFRGGARLSRPGATAASPPARRAQRRRRRGLEQGRARDGRGGANTSPTRTFHSENSWGITQLLDRMLARHLVSVRGGSALRARRLSVGLSGSLDEHEDDARIVRIEATRATSATKFFRRSHASSKPAGRADRARRRRSPSGCPAPPAARAASRRRNETPRAHLPSTGGRCEQPARPPADCSSTLVREGRVGPHQPRLPRHHQVRRDPPLQLGVHISPAVGWSTETTGRRRLGRQHGEMGNSGRSAF